MKNKGFSLIELIVAVSVFSVVAVISSAALLNMSDAQQKVLSLRNAQDHLSYALDAISREIRMGNSYHCGNDISVVPLDCSSGNSSITFINASHETITYRLNSGILQRSADGGANFQSLTPTDLLINDLKFYVLGTLPLPADTLQPRVTIILSGVAGEKEKTKSKINVQTTVSQRSLDSEI